MQDLISRQDAIDAIEQMQTPIMRSAFEYEQFIFRGMCEALNVVKALPSAQPEPHWIPCSERLPELDDEVLVTDDGGELRHCIFCILGETWCGFVTYEEGMRIEATAWMPLPPAYKGGE